MDSVKLRWERVWEALWRAIPDPLTDGRLLLALDDSMNPKTGRKVFGCQPTFDHAAKTNQSQYPWAQAIVTLGLLKVIDGRRACLPLAFAFYLRLQTLRAGCLRVRGEAVVFQSKFAQAVRLVAALARVFGQTPILVVADSRFGNNGLLKPLRAALGPRVHLLSRLRVNTVLYVLPAATAGAPGRPRKYGGRLANTATLAATLRAEAHAYTFTRMAGYARRWPSSAWSCSRPCAAKCAWSGCSARPSGLPW